MEQIDYIFDIILLVCAVFYLAVILRHDMQMLQQNSYRNERYQAWVRKSGDSCSVPRLLLMAMVLLSQTWMATSSWYVKAIMVAVLLILAVVQIRKKHKKPLVFTNRVKRLYFTESAIMLTLVAVLALFTAEYRNGAAMALFMGATSWVFTKFTNWVLKPVESHINQGFINDAKRILAGMPQMKIVGITGSYGKTSTKHYLYRILSEKYSVLMTPGSFNTPMGVVRTVRENLQPYNNLFIVEMGAKNIGDIKEICDIVNPEVGIVTAVGAQHLESFKSIENVQRTKFELIDALPANGFAVVNNDFPFVANREVSNVAVSRYAVNADADYHATDIKYSARGTEFTITGKDINLHLTTHLLGECNISNLMAAVIVAKHLGVSDEKIKYAVSKIEQVEHRLNVKRTASGITIIDDAFNSNPDGSRMALDTLAGFNTGKRIVITPGMIELGEKQEHFNRLFGEHIAETCDIAIVVGEYNRAAIVEGIKSKESNVELIEAATFAEAQQIMLSKASAGDTVLYENDLPDTFK